MSNTEDIQLFAALMGIGSEWGIHGVMIAVAVVLCAWHQLGRHEND